MRFQMPDGFKAEFIHHRYARGASLQWQGRYITPSAETICVLHNEHGLPVTTGVAWCRNTDQFSKSIGRQIALGRALKMYHESRIPVGNASP